MQVCHHCNHRAVVDVRDDLNWIQAKCISCGRSSNLRKPSASSLDAIARYNGKISAYDTTELHVRFIKVHDDVRMTSQCLWCKGIMSMGQKHKNGIEMWCYPNHRVYVEKVNDELLWREVLNV